MTALLTVIALALSPSSVLPAAPPWEPRPVAIPMPLPPATRVLHAAEGPNLHHAIDAWFEVDARNQAWYAWELETWLAIEADNKLREQAEPPPPTAAPPLRAAAFAPPPSSGWLHAWITDAILNELGMCESTNNYQVNTGNGFYGRVQWLKVTWNAAAARADRPDLVGIRPDLVAPADQDYVTKVWWSLSDYRGQWPVCGPRAVARAG